MCACVRVSVHFTAATAVGLLLCLWPSEYESLLLKHTAGLANLGAVDVHMMVRVWRSAISVGGSARSQGGSGGVVH